MKNSQSLNTLSENSPEDEKDGAKKVGFTSRRPITFSSFNKLRRGAYFAFLRSSRSLTGVETRPEFCGRIPEPPARASTSVSCKAKNHLAELFRWDLAV
jgi:hypothetical protein